MKGLNRMQKKKYSKPVLEVEYYTLETTIAACVSTSTDSSSTPDQTDEENMFASISAYAVYGESNCSCYYSAGSSGSSYSSHS